MRALKMLAVTLLAVSLGRGVRLLSPQTAAEMPSAFDAKQSAALFIGVRHFPNDPALGEVRYAVDDAVNMAWLFAMDARVSLVAPERVVLAIEGAPQKEASRKQLRQLIEAGAKVRPADKDAIETLLAQQAESVGSGGIFIASFATHGFSRDGASYVLASTSVYTQPDTSLPAAKVQEVAGRAPRSLLFFDACRERQGSRASMLPPPFAEAMTSIAGQVSFMVASEFAWENPSARNGAFTAAIVAGLQCKAETDGRGYVTVDTLADYTEKRLRGWLVKYRDPFARKAIRVETEGDSDDMPLATCTLPPSLFRQSPARAAFEAGTLSGFDAKGASLWRIPIRGRVAASEVADLDGDGANEVVLSVDGRLVILRPDGSSWWAKDTSVPDNYGSGDGHLTMTKFIVGDLYRKKRQQIVALSVDASGAPASRIAVFDADGTEIGGYFHPGRLLNVAIARPTARHAPKIIVTAINAQLHDQVTLCGNCSSVFVLDPKRVEGEAPPYRGKLGFGSQVWYGYVLASTIDRLDIEDHNHDGRSDIRLEIPNGNIAIDFDGKVIEAKNAQFGLVK